MRFNGKGHNYDATQFFAYLLKYANVKNWPTTQSFLNFFKGKLIVTKILAMYCGVYNSVDMKCMTIITQRTLQGNASILL